MFSTHPGSKEELEAHLKQHHHSLSRAADTLGYDRSAMSRFLNGHTPMPLLVAEALARAGIDPTELASRCTKCDCRFFGTQGTRSGCCAHCTAR